MILISVIIPVYNVENYIRDCLISVLDQANENVEIIIVDDCGTDNSISIAHSVISEYNDCNVKFLQQAKNGGLSNARNAGINNASGKYMYFLDSDDELLPGSIPFLISSILDNKIFDFAVYGMNIIGSKNKMIDKLCDKIYTNNSDILNALLNNEYYVMACGKLFRKDFICEHKLYFEDGLLHEDELFTFKCVYYANKVIVKSIETYLYKVRSSNTITSNLKHKNFTDLLYIFRIRNEMLRKRNDLVPEVRLNYLLNYYVAFNVNLVNNIENVSQDYSSLHSQCRRLLNDNVLLFKSLNIKLWLKILFVESPFFINRIALKILHVIK